MLLDLHNHTWPRSHDSVLDPDDLVARAKGLGLDGICLTEHDAVWDSKEVEAMAVAVPKLIAWVVKYFLFLLLVIPCMLERSYLIYRLQ